MFSAFLEEIKAAAREAGGIMKSAHGAIDAEQAKSGHANFVTIYDKKVQAFLIERLSQILPDAHFVGEEDGREVFPEEYRKGYTFVIDPIDGTSNFMKNYGASVTSIGLLKDNEPYIGVVYNPWTDVMFWAEKDCGAYENDQKITTSDSTLAQSLVAIGTSPYYEELRPLVLEIVETYLPLCIDLRRSGSAEWDICMVASGRTGLFVEPKIQIWDYAAGAAILAEAGGILTDIEGKKLNFTGGTTVVAAGAGVAGEPYLLKDLRK